MFDVEKFIRESILEAVKYKNGEQREPKTFSGSQWSNTLLQNYLIETNKLPDEKEIGQSQIGSLLHLAMENVIKDKDKVKVEKEISISKTYKNGWKATGTIDLIIHDENNNTYIIDHKFTKIYAGKMIKKEINHGYKEQLRHYGAIYDKEEVELVLNLFYKDANPLKMEPAHELIYVTTTPNEIFEERFIYKTDEIQSFIDGNIMPPECSNADKWYRAVGNRRVATRCEQYCSVREVCPYYKGVNVEKRISEW